MLRLPLLYQRFRERSNMKNKGNAVPYETVMVIDGTEYIVHTSFSRDANETAYDKVKRLILNNVDSVKKDPAA